MRFSVTMPDDLILEIDAAAARDNITRAEWIRQACTDALTTEAPGPAPEDHQVVYEEVIGLRARAEYQARTIADLEADRGYLRSEVARLVQENTVLMHRLLPPSGGMAARIRRWWSGGDE